MNSVVFHLGLDCCCQTTALVWLFLLVDQTGVDFQFHSFDRGRSNRNCHTGLSDNQRSGAFRNCAETKCKIALMIRADAVRTPTNLQGHSTPDDWPALLVYHSAGDPGLTRKWLAFHGYEGAKHLVEIKIDLKVIICIALNIHLGYRCTAVRLLELDK